MTLALLCHLFDKEVLKVSSVTGSGKHQRQALDKNAVQFIIGMIHNLYFYVSHNFTSQIF